MRSVHNNCIFFLDRVLLFDVDLPWLLPPGLLHRDGLLPPDRLLYDGLLPPVILEGAWYPPARENLHSLLVVVVVVVVIVVVVAGVHRTRSWTPTISGTFPAAFTSVSQAKPSWTFAGRISTRAEGSSVPEHPTHLQQADELAELLII